MEHAIDIQFSQITKEAFPKFIWNFNLRGLPFNYEVSLKCANQYVQGSLACYFALCFQTLRNTKDM